MKSFGLGTYALSGGVAVALLGGCGGSQPPIGAPGTMRQTTAIATHADRGKSWILPEAKSEDLIYAVGGCGGTCVLSYPRGKLVGELIGVYGYADCSDGNGNVFISERTEVVEFAHGGTTPTATFNVTYTPVGCSVDTESGNLAVVNGGFVAVFPAGSRNAIYYNTLLDAHFCGYDNGGNLFVSGYDGETSGLSELAKGTGSFENLTLDQSVGAPGQVQWDGQYLTYESDNAAQTTISRLSISGSSTEVAGQTRLKKVRRWLEQSWIYKDSVIAPYSNRGAHGNILGIWKYPGGSSINVVTKFGDYDRKTFSFTGATISIAP
jgi:hypothetical protein